MRCLLVGSHGEVRFGSGGLEAVDGPLLTGSTDLAEVSQATLVPLGRVRPPGGRFARGRGPDPDLWLRAARNSAVLTRPNASAALETPYRAGWRIPIGGRSHFGPGASLGHDWQAADRAW
jgi:hypothetical protein